MDIRNWNKVLYQWITKCNFVENNFFNVEQTNIDTFYQKICEHHKEASKHTSLQSLLQTHYPDFQPHLDDENALSAAEYIYVYSLLLHFCCVKCPEHYFQITCQNLSEQTQQSIQIFFEHIIQKPNVNKEIIRQAIAEVNNFNLTAQQQQKTETINSNSLASSSNGMNSTTDLQTSFSTSSVRLNGDSPVSTPNRKTMSATQRVSPDTPKSSLLEERTRELHSYKAQLETESYEKSLLELQILQNEKQISAMKLEHKNLQQKIQELKDELLNKSFDINTSDREEDDTLVALRTELCNKIRDKEEEIFRLFDTISTLREENARLEGKLHLADKKFKQSRDYIKELELKLEELTVDLQKKELTIQNLTDDKADLEHFIAETRQSAKGNSRPNLDLSVECLDVSFTRYTNSSGSVSSPENLGASVVDVQLREKEQENNQLRQELNDLHARQTEFATFIQSQTKRFIQEYTFEGNNNNNDNKDSQTTKLVEIDKCELKDNGSEYFNIFLNCMNQLSKSFKDANNHIQKLEHDMTNINRLNSDLKKRIDDYENETICLKEQINTLETKQTNYLKEIEELQLFKQELAKNYETTVNDYEDRLGQSKLKTTETELKNKALEDHITNLNKQLDELNKRTTSAEAESKALNEKAAHQNAKLQSHMEAQRLVKANYEKLLIENDGLRVKMRENDTHMKEIRSKLHGKEIELGKLGKEIVTLGRINVEMEDKINKLTKDFQQERAKYDADLQELKIAYEKLQKTNDSLTFEKEAAIEQLIELSKLLGQPNIILNKDLLAALNAVRYVVEKCLSEKSNLIKHHENEIKALNKVVEQDEQNIKDFKRAVEVLEIEVDKSKKIIDEMSLEVEDLQAQAIILNDKHQRAENDWLTKREQLAAELSGEKEAKATQIANLQQLEEQLQKHVNEKEDLNKEKLNFETELKAAQNLLDQEKARWETQLTALKNKNDKLNSQNAELETVRLQIEADLAACKLNVQDLTNENQTLQAEQQANVERFKQISLQLEARNAKLEESQKMLIAANEQLKSKSSELKSINEKCDQHAQALESLKNQLKTAKETIEELKASKQALQVSYEESQTLLKNEQIQFEQKNIELQKRVSQLNVELREKIARISELDLLINDAENCLKALNDDSAELHNELAGKEIKLRALNEELSACKKAITHAQNFEHELNNFITFLEHANGFTTSLSSLNEFSAAKHDEKMLLQRLHAALSGNLKANDLQYQEKFQQHRQQIEALQAELDGQIQEQSKLKAAHQNATEVAENLERVNEKLSHENEILQIKLSNAETDLGNTQNQFGALRSLNERLTQRIAELEQRYLDELNATKAEQKILEGQLNELKSLHQALQKQNDEIQMEASEAETALRQRLVNLEHQLQQLQNENGKHASELANKNEENKLLAEKLCNLESKTTEDEAHIAQLKKKNIVLSVEFAELSEKYQNLYDEIQTLTSQLEEANSERAANAEMCDDLRAENQKLENALQAAGTQLKKLNEEIEATVTQQKSLVFEKQKISDELSDSKRAIDELVRDINDLKQKIALHELEKNDLRQEMELMQKQVELNGQYQTTSESKLKNINETSQALERNLLTAENELKSMQAKLDQSKANVDMLDKENGKLRDSKDLLTKRLEHYAFKLGEAQALVTKLENENQKLNTQLSQQNTNLETLQRDKHTIQTECKSLNERLIKLERLHEQISGKLQATEKANASLVAAKKALETSEVELKVKLQKSEIARQTSEERMRKICNDNKENERDIVNLNHEIGALNNEMLTLKNSTKVQEQKLKDDFNKQLNETRTRAEYFETVNQELESQQRDFKNKLETVTDKMSKLALTLEISNTKNSELAMVIQQLETSLTALKSDKVEFEKAQNSLTERLKTSQDFTEKLLKEKSSLEEQLASANTDLHNKDTELTALRLELNDVRLSSVENTAAVSDKTSALVAEIDSLQARLQAVEGLLAKEQDASAKLRMDNQILQAKYREAKQRVETESSSTEERIKENRLELEGKLEKMKNKMKALYTEEVTKMKTKQERETATLRAELTALKAQNAKYEKHTCKLSTELMNLNDRMLECQKENTHLLTKLKYIQSEEGNKFKRPNISNAMPTTSSSSSLAAVATSATASTAHRLSTHSTHSMPRNIATDLAMEDEEGEIFNNTYLTDLKNGRITNDICPEELMRRNSQLPPHLKSSYAPQYDHGLCEDEVKDGQPQGLDDSMSVLLTSNTSCARKKLSGITHYHKPGPPTPSKNGGRLSFGGSSEPTREILKESYDEGGNATLSKTPARFGFFTSRFSMGSNNFTKDENTPPKRRLSSIFKKKA